jgi:hypothetical protein
MNMYRTLINLGATIETPLVPRPDRQEVCGRMWGGKSVLAWQGHKFYFDLWHHGPDADLSAGDAEEHLSLRGLFTPDGDYHDAYWTVITPPDGSFWLHDSTHGWFGLGHEVQVEYELLSRLPVPPGHLRNKGLHRLF